jgi:predicted ArsR family transcriptional regulator
MREIPGEITDPKALRALAHPLRWKLLDVITREGTATATRCAEEVGESVANCSYHLNTLAKYGFVEQAEGGQGREKPWRRPKGSVSWTDRGLDDDASRAAHAATTAFIDFQFAEIRERTQTLHLEPDDWREALGMNNTNEYLTAAEVAEMHEEIAKIMARFRHRGDNPEARPEGARLVNLFWSTTVAPGIKPE